MYNEEHVERTVTAIRESFAEGVEAVETIRSGICQLLIDRERLLEVLRLAKEECEFNMLFDLTAADYLEREPYFHVIYLLHSHEHLAKLLLKVRVNREEPVLPSATELWPAANWFERELYDLFGVRFEGHPNLERILMPDDWTGHPLRRDYPLTEEPVQFQGHVSEMLPSEVIAKQFESDAE